MSKSGWLYRQFKWIEKDSKNWPDWMSDEKIECSGKKSEIKKKEARPKRTAK